LAEFFYLTLITLISSVALAIMIAAFIIFLGRDYAFLSWTILQLFILLSAPLFPVSILPLPLQIIAHFMPFTNIFVAVREMVRTGFVEESILTRALMVSLVYLFLSSPLYLFAFKRAKKTGKLANIG